MDLILWRHAEAEETETRGDLERRLTARGERQAARMAQWLLRHLPESARVLSSPAERALRTAQALERKVKLMPALAPGLDGQQLLDAAGWPGRQGSVVVVGHQPAIGQAVAMALTGHAADWPIRKGAVWWLRHRVRDGIAQTVLLSVQAPDLL